MAWGLQADVGEAVGAVQPGTAWEAPAGRRSAGSQKDGPAKGGTPDLSPKCNIKDISQTDSSCLITTGNMDPRHSQNTCFLYLFTSINHSCL